MEDLSLHVLDIAENAINAGATRIDILVAEDREEDLLALEVTDNGHGMEPEVAENALDPFYTTRLTRRVGLGLPFLHEAAIAANGYLEVHSQPEHGTTVKAMFQLSHIDRKPLGDMAETIATLVASRPDIAISYCHEREREPVCFSTEEVSRHLPGVPVNSPEVVAFIREYLHQREEAAAQHHHT